MAEITIRLRYNAQTGKKDLLIDYHSDDDALPLEHEQEHREIVERLLGQGILNTDEVGEVVVSRVAPRAAQDQQDRTAAPEALQEGQE